MSNIKRLRKHRERLRKVLIRQEKQMLVFYGAPQSDIDSADGSFFMSIYLRGMRYGQKLEQTS